MISEIIELEGFKRFLERIEEKEKDWLATLKGSGDSNEIFRAQGALNFAEFVKDLPDMMKVEEEQEKNSAEAGKDSGQAGMTDDDDDD